MTSQQINTLLTVKVFIRTLKSILIEEHIKLSEVRRNGFIIHEQKKNLAFFFFTFKVEILILLKGCIGPMMKRCSEHRTQLTFHALYQQRKYKYKAI